MRQISVVGGNMKKLLELLLLFSFLVLMTACKRQEYIIVGFTNELSGTHSELGIHSLYGAQIAIDEINQDGGVDGKKLKLVVRNDEGDTSLANAYNQELIDMGAVAIIGHSTSKMANSVIEYAGENDFLIISPTISTKYVSGLDDNFIRMIPSDDAQAYTISEYFLDKNLDDGMLIIYDSTNSEYSLGLANKIEDLYEVGGGEIHEDNYIPFVSSSQEDLERVVNLINATSNRNLIIVASVYDTSVIIQSIENAELFDIYISMWGATNYLLEIAGQNIFGCHGDGFLPQEYTEKMQNFTDIHFELYGIEPEYSSVFGYEAVYLLYEALKVTNDHSAKALKKAIIEIGEYEGLTSKYTIDQYGDIVRPIYSYIITENGYEVIENEEDN